VTDGPARAETFDGRTGDELARRWGVPAVEIWSSVSSTNDRAIVLAVSGAARGTTVVADEQTGGRGRRGAPWISARGAGLWMSVVLDASDAVPQLPLLVGVACAEGIDALTDAAHLGVKWPNDLTIAGRKVGGVLAEGASGRVVVGVGINLTLPPPEAFAGRLGTYATALEMEGIKGMSRSDLAESILGVLWRRLGGCDPGGDAIRALVERDALLNRAVHTEQSGSGVARGVDRTGALVLERADGSRVLVVSGSVRLVEPHAGAQPDGGRPSGSRGPSRS
jgi:BirA family biotin operon repressor/biotin-[acetyl-CoA-carboxylase] ligase